MQNYCLILICRIPLRRPGTRDCVPSLPLCSGGGLIARGNWLTSRSGPFQNAHKRAEDDVALSSIIRWSRGSSQGWDDSAYCILKHSLAFLAVKVMSKDTLATMAARLHESANVKCQKVEWGEFQDVPGLLTVAVHFHFLLYKLFILFSYFFLFIFFCSVCCCNYVIMWDK